MQKLKTKFIPKLEAGENRLTDNENSKTKAEKDKDKFKPDKKYRMVILEKKAPEEEKSDQRTSRWQQLTENKEEKEQKDKFKLDKDKRIKILEESEEDLKKSE